MFGIVTSLLFSFFHLKKHHKIERKSYLITCLLFVLYLSIVVVAIVGFPTLSEFFRLRRLGKPIFNSNVLLIPFGQGMDISTLLNIVVFIPLGLFLPLLWRRFEKWLPTFLLAVTLSLTIEVGQLFTLQRLTDVNDLIMNVVGVTLGWLIYKVSGVSFGHEHGLHGNEWLILIPAIFVCSFLFG